MDLLLSIILIVAFPIVAAAFAGGVIVGRRWGKGEGFAGAVRQLLRAKDEQCWLGARYLEIDTLAEAETQRLARKRP